MALFYSATVGGFLDDAIHADLPADAVPVSAAEHQSLLAGQRDGRPIVAFHDGRPVNASRLPPSVDARRADLLAAVKAEAARRILAVAPIWRQLNDAADIARCAGAGLRVEDAAEAWARRDRIDAIRAASDALETRIAAASDRSLARIDVTAAGHWPA